MGLAETIQTIRIGSLKRDRDDLMQLNQTFAAILMRLNVLVLWITFTLHLDSSCRTHWIVAFPF